MDNNIRLRGTGFGVRIQHFPDNFIEAIIHTIKQQDDPYVVLAGYAYMICGLKVNDIRDLFILSDRKKTRKASREYIRQKVVTFYQSVYDSFKELHGDIELSLLYWDNDASCTYNNQGVPVNISKGEEDIVDEESPDDESEEISTKNPIFT